MLLLTEQLIGKFNFDFLVRDNVYSRFTLRKRKLDSSKPISPGGYFFLLYSLYICSSHDLILNRDKVIFEKFSLLLFDITVNLFFFNNYGTMSMKKMSLQGSPLFRSVVALLCNSHRS